MKKFISVLLVIMMCFTCVSCAGNKSDEETTVDPSLLTAPILGVHIRNGDKAGFYALTKNGSYTWNVTYGNGKAEQKIYDGIFCLDSENLCTFTREDAGESIELKFTGDVESYEIYSAEKSELDSENKSEILDEKYLISENQSKITFPESGEYYYVVNVKYSQGEVPYGFIITE